MKRATFEQAVERLDEAERLRLARKLETAGDSAEGATGDPIADMLHDTLRPTLSAGAVPRRRTVRRAFFEPLEGLVYDAAPNAPPRNDWLIARSHLEPFWRAARQNDGFQTALDMAARRGPRDDVAPDLARMWAIASTEGMVATNALAPADLQRLRKALGVATVVMELRATCSMWPLPELMESDLNKIAKAYESANALCPEGADAIVFLIASGLVRPAELFKLFRIVAKGGDDEIVQGTTLVPLGEEVLQGLEESIKQLPRDLMLGDDGESFLKRLKRLVADYDMIVQNFRIRRAGDWGQRLKQMKLDIGEVFETRVLGKAPKKIFGGLPGAPSGPAFRGNPSHAVHPDKRLEAETYAFILSACGAAARRLGFASKLAAFTQQAATDLERLSEKLVLHAEKQPVDEASVRTFEIVVEALCGEEEASLLHRRLRAAQRHRDAA
ncbi:MAG: hypothetical protein NXI21_07785 [Alphaproteobacteria bacterium]|nr:hypothetical protein [Alphaproteobacteria bacterium]